MAPTWVLRLHPENAAHPLRAMPPGPRKAMKKALASLAGDPSGKGTGLDVRRLTATAGTNVYRLRVGDWRAAFLLRARAVEVIRVFHRSEGYGWLERLYP